MINFENNVSLHHCFLKKIALFSLEQSLKLLFDFESWGFYAYLLKGSPD